MGRTVVFIAPDVWAVDLPVIFGQVEVNALDWIENKTDALLRSLGEPGAHQVCLKLVRKLDQFNEMQQFRRDFGPDLDASVTCLVEHPIQPGLAKWAALQAAEKTLKAFIRLHKQEPSKQGHDLQKLADHAARAGMGEVASELIAQVQCPAGVRYGEVAVSPSEAVDAHDAAVEICHFAAAAESEFHKNFVFPG